MPVIQLLNQQNSVKCDFVPLSKVITAEPIQPTNAPYIQVDAADCWDAPLLPFNPAELLAPNAQTLPTTAEEESLTQITSCYRYTHNPYGTRRVYNSLIESGHSEDPFSFLADTRDTSTVKYALDFAASSRFGSLQDSNQSDTVKAALTNPMSFLAANAAENFWSECETQSHPSPILTSKTDVPAPIPNYPIRHCLFGVSQSHDLQEGEQDYKLLAQYTSMAPDSQRTLVGHSTISGCTVYTYIAADSLCHGVPSCRPPQWNDTSVEPVQDPQQLQSSVDEDSAIATIISMVALQQHRDESPLPLNANGLHQRTKEAQLVQQYSICGGSSYLPTNVRTRRIITQLNGGMTKAYMSHKHIAVIQAASSTTAGDNETPVGRGTTPNGVSLAQATKLSHVEAKAGRGLLNMNRDVISPFHFSAPPTPTPAAVNLAQNNSAFGTPIIVSPTTNAVDDFHNIPYRHYVR